MDTLLALLTASKTLSTRCSTQGERASSMALYVVAVVTFVPNITHVASPRAESSLSPPPRKKQKTNEVGHGRLASKVFSRKGTTNKTHLSNKILTRLFLSFADAMKMIQMITTSRKENLEQRMFALRWHVWIYTAEAHPQRCTARRCLRPRRPGTPEKNSTSQP